VVYKDKNTGKLSLKEALKIGITGFGRRKGRLFLSTLITCVALIIFGIMLSMVTFDKTKVFIKSMYETNNYFLWGSSSVSDINELNDTLPENFFARRDNFDSIISNGLQNVALTNLSTSPEKIGSPFFEMAIASGFFEITDTIANEFDFSLLAGTFPSEKNEVMITAYHYMYFKEGGYLDFYSKETTDISTYDDIIGKKVGSEEFFQHNGGFVICGIIDTHCDLGRFEELRNQSFISEAHPVNLDLSNAYREYILSNAHALFFVAPGTVKTISDSLNYDEDDTFIDSYSDVVLYNPSDTFGANVPLKYITKSSLQVYRKEKPSAENYFEQFPFEIYWKGNTPLNELEENQIIVSLESLMSSRLMDSNTTLYELFSERLTDEINSFATTDFQNVEEAMQVQYNNPTVDDYINYLSQLSDGEDNAFQPGYGMGYFLSLAQEYAAQLCFGNNFPILNISTGLRGLNIPVDIVGIYSLRHHNDYNFYGSTFVSDSFYGEIVPDKLMSVVVALSGNYYKDLALINNSKSFNDNGNIPIVFYNSILKGLITSDFVIKNLINIFVIVFVVIAVFTILFLLNFFSSIVVDEKKMMLILRSLGIPQKDLFKIHIPRSIFLITFCVIFSSIGALIAISFLNNYLSRKYSIVFSPLVFDFSIFGIMMLLGTIVVMIGTLIPIKSILKSKLFRVM
jgi:hypothetical protein